MPKSKLEARLTRQLAGRGQKGAAGMAHALLVKRGDINADGSLTAHGEQRQALGAAGRAKDRASKQSGRPPSDYKYDPHTNRARIKKP